MSGTGTAAALAGSWRAALRISRREVLRHRARSLLIVAMLALPVFGTVAAETVIDTTQNLSVSEQLTRDLGGFDAMAQVVSGQPIYQSTDVHPEPLPVHQSQDSSGSDGGQSPAGLAAANGRIRAALPRAAVVPAISGDVFAHGPGGYATVNYTRTELTDPGFQGVYDLVDGRLPNLPDEIDLSPSAASSLGAHIGDRIALPKTSTQDSEDATLTVVGLMRLPGSTKESDIFAPSSAPAAYGGTTEFWYIHQPGGVSWNQVRQLDESGVMTTSREVVQDPPPASQVPYSSVWPLWQDQSSAQQVAAQAAIAAITVGIALLEVVLLAGPAFAVSARRREREFAVLGAAGADAADLRRIVLADGVVLGVVAGVLGVGLGVGAAAAVLPFVPSYNGTLPGSLHVNALHAAGVALLAVVLGLCSAYVPARAAGRRDIAATLAGRRVTVARRIGRGRVLSGLGLVALGMCGVVFCRELPEVDLSSVSVVAGIALVEIGGILCTPAVVAAVARLGHLLPLGPRLALRDSARNPGRTTPAVAAMFAAVAGAVAAGAWLDSSLAQERAAYRPLLLANQVAVGGVTGQHQTTQILDALHDVMPVTGSTLVQAVDAVQGPSGTTGTRTLTIAPQTQGQAAGQAGSFAGCPAGGFSVGFGSDGSPQSTCGGDQDFGLVQDVVGDARTLRGITGLDNQQADRVLAQGGVVLFGPGASEAGKAELSVEYQYTTKQDPRTKRQSTKTLTVPAAFVAGGAYPSPGFVLAPSAAHALGVDGGAGPRTLFVDLASPATADQVFGGTQALNRIGVQYPLEQELGLQTRLGLANLIVLLAAMLVAIGAAAIATSIALADGRRDQETVSAVGGSPWMRRRMAGSTALVVTGLGMLIGIPVGFAISAGLVKVGGQNPIPLLGNAFYPRTPLRFQVPWLDLGALAVAVPLLTALGAVLLSRSKPSASGRVAD